MLFGLRVSRNSFYIKGGMAMDILIGILLPLLGTSLGAACVYAMKKEMNKTVNKILLGFASGVMIAAAIWSLIIPAIEMSGNMGKFSFVPAAVGVMGGVMFLFSLDKVIPHIHVDSDKPEGTNKYNLKKTTKLILAVALHNLPEGMAVGIVFASIMNGSSTMTIASAFALSIGIAIQNFPEGAIISMPLKSEGLSKNKSFLYGVLSGVVEPIGAAITILFSSTFTPIMPYLLSFAAGAMIFVVVEELIPQAAGDSNSDISAIAFSIGFVIMMILDVALS